MVLVMGRIRGPLAIIPSDPRCVGYEWNSPWVDLGKARDLNIEVYGKVPLHNPWGYLDTLKVVGKLENQRALRHLCSTQVWNPRRVVAHHDGLQVQRKLCTTLHCVSWCGMRDYRLEVNGDRCLGLIVLIFVMYLSKVVISIVDLLPQLRGVYFFCSCNAPQMSLTPT